MAIVTKITTQKQSTERFNIYLDDGQGEKYAFSVDQDILIKYNLQKGKEIDELDIQEIQYGDLSKKAYNKALEFLSYRMRSIKEVVDHLAKKEFTDAVIQDVIYKLKEYNYVDDLEFAIAYVRTQKQTNGKGPSVLKRELIGKGISPDFIEQALIEYNDDDQLQEAIDHAEKLLKKNNKMSTVQLRQKIEQHLMRKGFPYTIISKVLDEVQYEQDESEEWTALVKHAEKARRKYQNEDPFQYQVKMKQFLYRKGFSMELIERFLEDEE